jgi:hypothetical protein
LKGILQWIAGMTDAIGYCVGLSCRVVFQTFIVLSRSRISSSGTSFPRLQPGHRSAASSHAAGEARFDGQKGHVRH